MIATRAVAVALLLTVLAPLRAEEPAAADTAAVRSDPPRHAVELRLRDGTPWLELELGGGKGWFLLDTGANASGVDRTWLKETGARHTPGKDGTLGGTTGAVVVGHTRFERLALGEAAFVEPRFVVHDYSGFRAPPGASRQAGLIGSDFLRFFQVTVDYDAARASFLARDQRGPPSLTRGAVALSWINGHPTVGVRVAGLGIPCRIDSGASYLSPGPFLDVNAHAVAALRAAGVALRPAGSLTVRGVSGSARLPLLKGDLRLELGPLALEGVTLVVHESGALNVDGPLALASASVLSRAGSWVLDPFDHLMWIGRGPRTGPY